MTRDPLADARAAGLRVEFADLGQWSPLVLVSEYDQARATIRINAAVVRAVRKDLGEAEANALVRAAVAHELYHHAATVRRPPPSTTRRSIEAEAHAFARDRYGVGPSAPRASFALMLYAGVDGGQSGSRAVVADESGAILSRVRGGPLFVRGEHGGSALIAELAGLLRNARAEAGTRSDEPLRALVAGISGQDVAALVNAADLGAGSARLVHDAQVAHAGALAGYRGIVVVAGSGSVAFGTDALGRAERRGGWGRTFGDEGSAFWIGRRAIGAAMRAADEGTPTGITAAACALFAVPTLRALQGAARSGAMAPEEIAGFAPTVLSLAAEGDAVAAGVRACAVAELCRLAVLVHRALESETGRAVSFGGRVFSDAPLRTAWRDAVTAALPAPRVVPPRAGAEVGALVLAYRDAGVEPPPALFRTAQA